MLLKHRKGKKSQGWGERRGQEPDLTEPCVLCRIPWISFLERLRSWGKGQKERGRGREREGETWMEGGGRRERGLRRDVESSDLFYKNHSSCYVGTGFRETRMKAGRLIRRLLAIAVIQEKDKMGIRKCRGLRQA